MESLKSLVRALARQSAVEVAWLYGSRATNTYGETSDYDIAVAFYENVADRIQAVDDLQYALNCIDEVGVPVSVVDLNRAATPLAYNVIEAGRVIHCESDLRLRQEQQRIWSLWEAYKYHHVKNRKTL